MVTPPFTRLPIYKTLTVNGSAVRVCSKKTQGEYNKLGNRQFLSFNLSDAIDNYTITVTRASGLASTDPDILLYKEGSAILIGESANSNTEVLSENLTSGSYVLEVYEFSNIDQESGTGGDACFDITNNQLRVSIK